MVDFIRGCVCLDSYLFGILNFGILATARILLPNMLQTDKMMRWMDGWMGDKPAAAAGGMKLF